MHSPFVAHRNRRTAVLLAVLAAAGCAADPPASCRRSLPRDSYVPPNAPPALPGNRSVEPSPATAPFPEPSHWASPAAQRPAVHLVPQQAVPLPGTLPQVTALLLDLKTDDPRRAKVRLTSSDGETIEVVWESGQELNALGSRLYLQVWRDASVYVLP